VATTPKEIPKMNAAAATGAMACRRLVRMEV